MFVTARIYPSAQQARDAYDELQAKGFRRETIGLITPPEEDPSSGALNEALRAGGLLGPHAAFYASSMEPGQSLVVVEPAFGFARLADKILRKHGPLDTVHELTDEEQKYVPASQKAAPLSAAMGWDVLSKEAAPLSSAWGLGTKADNQLSFISRIFAPLSKSNFSMFGSGLMDHNPAPLSSMFGMPLKSGQSGNRWTSSFGFPLLTDSAGPLRTGFLGLPLLSRKRWTY